MSDLEIQELYAASYRRLLGQLIGVTGSVAEAEDVVQEAFLRGLDHVECVGRVRSLSASCILISR